MVPFVCYQKAHHWLHHPHSKKNNFLDFQHNVSGYLMAFFAGSELDGNKIITSACDITLGLYFLRDSEMTTYSSMSTQIASLIQVIRTDFYLELIWTFSLKILSKSQLKCHTFFGHSNSSSQSSNLDYHWFYIYFYPVVSFLYPLVLEEHQPCYLCYFFIAYTVIHRIHSLIF